MQKLIVSWFQINSLLIASIITLLIAFLSLINVKDTPITKLNLSDKILHFSAYFILMLTWLFANRNSKRPCALWKVFLILVLFGIIIELLQGYLTYYRSMDWKDVLANTIGLFISLLFYSVTSGMNFRKNN